MAIVSILHRISGLILFLVMPLLIYFLKLSLESENSFYNFLSNTPLNYNNWHGFFYNQWFIVASILAFVSLILHTWIGVWTVTTDYIKCTIIRLSIQMFVLLWLLLQLIWCLLIGRG